MDYDEYRAFKVRPKVHTNENIRVRIVLVPPSGESAPDISGWSFSAPAKQADGSLLYGGISVDAVTPAIVVDVAAGDEAGTTQVDVLTDQGTSSSWFRLGSIFARVREGSGAHD